MKLAIATVAYLLIFLVAISRCEAGAEAYAHGSFGDSGSKADDDAGEVDADASVINTSPDGDKYYAYGFVDHTSLHAYADALRPNKIESSGAQSSATVTWTDYLEVQNPDVNSGPAYIFFSPQAKGTASSNAAADFQVSLFDPSTGLVFDQKSKSVNGPTSKAMKLRFFEPLSYFFGPVAFYMSLTVGASATHMGDFATADYDHTAYLPPLYIGDINGNPLPLMAGVRIVGSSGRIYPVTTVQRVPGDYSGNGVVDAADYVVWRKSYGQTGLSVAADGDASQVVDLEDLDVWKINFGETFASIGQSSGSFSSVVPEPATSTMLVLAATLLVRRRVRITR